MKEGSFVERDAAGEVATNVLSTYTHEAISCAQLKPEESAERWGSAP
jgi:hypothetical protein